MGDSLGDFVGDYFQRRAPKPLIYKGLRAKRMGDFVGDSLGDFVGDARKPKTVSVKIPPDGT